MQNDNNILLGLKAAGDLAQRCLSELHDNAQECQLVKVDREVALVIQPAISLFVLLI